jgi:hypothetical protein
MRIERLANSTLEESGLAVSYTHVKRLVEKASADGLLTREEDEVILAAIVSRHGATAEMCALFRSLQEQVWNGELVLGD